jgi:hypothetical protein
MVTPGSSLSQSMCFILYRLLAAKGAPFFSVKLFELAA